MKLIKQLSVYTLVGFLGAGLNFILLPYLSNYLLPSDYGILSILNSLITILIPLVSLTAYGWVNIEFYKTRDPAEFASRFSSAQLVPILPFVVLLLLSIIFKNPITQWLEIPLEKSYWVVLSTGMALLTIYYETLLNITVSQQKPGVYSLVILVKLTIEIILTVVFIAYFSMSWEGRLYAWLISLMFSVILAAPYFHRCRFLTWNVRWSHYLSAIYFGLPLILHSIGKFIINQSDRIFITKMISIDEAGIYSIGYQVGTAVLLLVNAAGNFFQPYLYERLTTRSPKGNHEIVKTSYQLALLFILFQVLLWIGSPLLFKWLINPQYTESVKYIFWIGLGYVFWGLYIIMTGYIFYSGNNSFLGYLAIVNIILNIGLNYIMITHYGALGAAYATCISFFVVFVIVFVKANQLYPMPWLEWIKRKV